MESVHGLNGKFTTVSLLKIESDELRNGQEWKSEHHLREGPLGERGQGLDGTPRVMDRNMLTIAHYYRIKNNSSHSFLLPSASYQCSGASTPCFLAVGLCSAGNSSFLMCDIHLEV